MNKYNSVQQCSYLYTISSMCVTLGPDLILTVWSNSTMDVIGSLKWQFKMGRWVENGLLNKNIYLHESRLKAYVLFIDTKCSSLPH